jgi:hypothetical protein
MTPAKPQQMSGQKDDPDDLIAELTKLMAADPKSSTAGGSRDSVPPSPEVRIPGQQTIRIPGVSQPVAAPGAPASASGKFDFGQAARPAAGPSPEPRADWQDRLGIKAKADPDPLASFDLPPATSQSASNWRPALAPGEAEPQPAASPAAFDFDFGFNRERPAPQARQAPQPVATPRPAPAASPSSSFSPAATPSPAPQSAAPRPAAPQPAQAYDPIAELIAAELGAQMQSSAEPATAYTAPPQAAPAPPPPATQPMNFAPYQAPAAPVAAPFSAPQAHEAAAPRPVASRPAPQPENDRFTTAPVFGLGNRVTGDVPAPKVELDPMDEIENLIGEAVRVELNMPQPQVRAYESTPQARAPQAPASPAVPPLGTQFGPRRTTSLREPDLGGGADEAILAAAAATGAEVGRIDSPFGDERQTRQNKPKKQARQDRFDRDERPAGGAFRQLVIPAIAGTILLAGGFGLYWALGMSHQNTKAPVLTADATPAKTIPAKPADAAPHSVVMDELGGTAPATTQETLVSRDQTAGADAAQVAAAAPAASDAATAENGLANRKVRTVTVRPDGSIVSSDDSVAGAAQLPVSRPNVPAVPGVSAATTSDAASTAPTAGTAPTADAPGGTTISSLVANADATAPESGAAADSSGQTGAIAGTPDPNAPFPLPRPTRTFQQAPTQMSEAAPESAASAGAPATSSQPTSSVNAVIRSGNPGGAQPMDLTGGAASGADQSQPAAAPQVAAVDAGSTPAAAGSGHVQLSSQTSEAGAQASAASLLKRYGNLWGGTKLQVVKADLGAKGIYYRVMLPTASAADAVSICSSIKSTGGDCVANR